MRNSRWMDLSVRSAAPDRCNLTTAPSTASRSHVSAPREPSPMTSSAWLNLPRRCGGQRLRHRHLRPQLSAASRWTPTARDFDIAKIDWLAPAELVRHWQAGLLRAWFGHVRRPAAAQATPRSTNLALGGEPVGGLELVAHTTNHALAYDLTTRLDGAELHRARTDRAQRRLLNPGHG